MKPLRNCKPRPLDRTRAPNYPRMLEVGVLLVLGACSRGSVEVSHEQPPPARPGGAVASPMVDAAAPIPPAAAGSSPVAIDAPEAGLDAAKPDAKRPQAVRPPHPSPKGGVAMPFEPE